MLKEVIANQKNYQPGLSTDCVIFGFHDNQLKVLLIKTKYSENWALPGGFVRVEESIDEDGNDKEIDNGNLSYIEERMSKGSLKFYTNELIYKR